MVHLKSDIRHCECGECLDPPLVMMLIIIASKPLQVLILGSLNKKFSYIKNWVNHWHWFKSVWYCILNVTFLWDKIPWILIFGRLLLSMKQRLWLQALLTYNFDILFDWSLYWCSRNLFCFPAICLNFCAFSSLWLNITVCSPRTS